MKYTLLLISLIIFSCSQIVYDRPQPINKKEFSNIPPKFVGTYLSNEKDTILITRSNIMKIENGIVLKLSDDIVVKKYKGFYIFSLKLVDNWSVYLIDFKKNIIELYCINPTVMTLGKLENIINVKQLENKDFLIHPNKEEFKNIMKLYKRCLIFTPLDQ